MALRTIGYEGEGRTRRAIRIDEGPASASMPHQVGEGKTALIDGLPDRELTGAGQVERRFITETERAVRAVVTPSPIAPRPRPVAAAVAQEEPVVAEAAQDVTTETPEPLPFDGDVLAILADAVLEATHARDELAEAEARWTEARVALDAAYRALSAPPPAEDSASETIPATIPEPTPVKPSAEGGRATAGQLQQSRRNGQAAMQTAKARKAEPAIGGGSAPMAPFLRRMLDALVECDGDRTAAATRLGIKRTSLIGTLGKLRSRIDLTEREQAAISSARA